MKFWKIVEVQKLNDEWCSIQSSNWNSDKKTQQNKSECT